MTRPNKSSPKLGIDFEIITSSGGARMWINASDGSAIGRFSKFFGVDVHTTASAQRGGSPQCLYCTHGKAGPEDWEEFRKQIKTHYDIDVPADLITWDDSKKMTTPKPKKIKLSSAQCEVMKWLGKKWSAYPAGCTTYTVNGQRLCTLATLTPLERAGLIIKDAHGAFTGTEAGRSLTAELGL
jgi:hypothetical protein